MLNKNKYKYTTIYIAKTSILLSLYIVLQLIEISWSRFIWPQGGVIGFSFVIIIFATFKLDIYASSFINLVGTIISSLMMGAFIFISPWQLLLDYFSNPFIALPIAYWIIKLVKKQYYKLLIFSIMSFSIYFIFEVISGMIFFNTHDPFSYASFIYSFIYNISYMLPTYGISCILAIISWPKINNFFQ